MFGKEMINMRVTCSIVIGALLIILGTAYAEPTPEIKYLMNTPVTLFDQGMNKLSEFFAGKKYGAVICEDNKKGCEIRNIDLLNSLVSYSWERNKIFISSEMVTGHNINIKTAKKYCDEIIVKIRADLGVDLINPSDSYFIPLVRYFSHRDFKEKKEPKNLGKAIADIIEINISILVTNPKGKLLECKAPLLGKDIFYSE